MRRYTFLLILLPLLTACLNNETTKKKKNEQFSGYEQITELKNVAYGNIDRKELKVIPVDTRDESAEVDLGKIIDSVRFIKLEVTDSSLVGKIDKVFFDAGKIFVVDRSSAKGVFIFDANGKFLTRIGALGKAPNEFLDLRDVAIDKGKRQLILLDLSGRKCLFFDYEGNFLDSKKMYYYYSGLQVLDSSHVALSTETAANFHVPSINNNYLVIGDFEGRASAKYFPYNENARAFTYFNEFPLRKFGDQVFFNPRFNDTIFGFSGGELSARFALDLKGDEISDRDKRALTDAAFTKFMARYSYFNGEYVYTDNALFGKVITRFSPSYFIYSPSSGRTMSGRQLNITQPEFGFLTSSIGTANRNEMVSVANPGELMNMNKFMTRTNALKTVGKKFRELLKDVTENDNPVLFIYKIKPF